jgi:dTDP-4-dehydrorhamnose 3,5-epimerase-like enzyme
MFIHPDADVNTPRGFHAHKQLSQVILCVSGACRLVLDSGNKREDVILNKPNEGVLVEGLVWREMHDFSEGCVLVVLASAVYDEADYIRTYDQFLSEVNESDS